jgi:hypothetical protein
MKKQNTPRVDKLSISLPAEMAAWLRRASARELTTVSQIIKANLLPAFNARHAK